jgi:hypothetical protein
MVGPIFELIVDLTFALERSGQAPKTRRFSLIIHALCISVAVAAALFDILPERVIGSLMLGKLNKERNFQGYFESMIVVSCFLPKHSILYEAKHDRGKHKEAAASVWPMHDLSRAAKPIRLGRQ